MKHTKKTLRLKTEAIRDLSTRELAHIAGGYTTVIYCEPTMTDPGNGLPSTSDRDGGEDPDVLSSPACG